MIETRDEWVLQGFSCPNYLGRSRCCGADAPSSGNRSVDLAMRDAFRKMRRFLMTAKNLTEDEAISLMSIAVDFGITQVVDGNWGRPRHRPQGHLPGLSLPDRAHPARSSRS